MILVFSGPTRRRTDMVCPIRKSNEVQGINRLQQNGFFFGGGANCGVSLMGNLPDSVVWIECADQTQINTVLVGIDNKAMNTLKLLLLFVFALTFSTMIAPEQAAASGPIIARGAQRKAIKSTHILHRENRPLHFYGNTVRRRHSRKR